MSLHVFRRGGWEEGGVNGQGKLCPFYSDSFQGYAKPFLGEKRPRK